MCALEEMLIIHLKKKTLFLKLVIASYLESNLDDIQTPGLPAALARPGTAQIPLLTM